MKLKQTLLACAALVSSVQFAAAQNFNQTIVFGDSTEDAGWYANFKTGNSAFDNAIQAASAAGGNAHFTGPGPNYTQILAGKFGTTANEVNGPGGGTNFAIGGAFDNGTFDALFGPGLKTYPRWAHRETQAFRAPLSKSGTIWHRRVAWPILTPSI